MPGGEKLTRKRELALAALLSEASIQAAAAKVGVTERTLRSWLAQPAFAAAFKDRCRAVLDTATSALRGATEGAVECLRRNLTCGKAAAEIRAAVGILDHALKTVELLDLMKRLDALGDALERGSSGRTPPLNGSIGGPDPMRNNGHVAEPETPP
jgi:hypothetical protein